MPDSKLTSMRLRSFMTFLLLLPSCVAACAWQEAPSPVRISAGVAEQQVIKKVKPLYPQMALIARVQGTVLLNIAISTEGRVTSAKAISGHPLLIPPALDAVQKWVYRPYVLDGHAIAVTTTVEVPFWLEASHPESKLQEKQRDVLFAYESECRQLLEHKNYFQAESACGQLTDLANNLDPELRRERVDAFKLAGMAHSATAKFQLALAAYQDELNAAEAIPGIYPFILTGAYHDVATTFRAMGELQQAQVCYEKEESLLEQGRQQANSGRDRQYYSTALWALLREYASLLREAGKSSEAETAEAKGHEIEVQLLESRAERKQ